MKIRKARKSYDNSAKKENAIITRVSKRVSKTENGVGTELFDEGYGSGVGTDLFDKRYLLKAPSQK